MEIESNIFAWTDSNDCPRLNQTAIHIKRTLVANRITTILEQTQPPNWRHTIIYEN